MFLKLSKDKENAFICLTISKDSTTAQWDQTSWEMHELFSEAVFLHH